MAAERTLATLIALASVLFLKLVPLAVANFDREPLLLHCGMLPTEVCAFAVDSAGQRCVLETLFGGLDWHECQTSDIMVSEGSPVEYIETEQCVNSCGVQKMTVGLSSDSLESSDFLSKLCSTECQEECFNLVDLYTNLAAGEDRPRLRISSATCAEIYLWDEEEPHLEFPMF